MRKYVRITNANMMRVVAVYCAVGELLTTTK